MLSYHPPTASCDNNIGDIEDIVSDSVSLSDQQRVGNKSHIVPRARKVKTSHTKVQENDFSSHKRVTVNGNGCKEEQGDGFSQRDSYVPGRSNHFICA